MLDETIKNLTNYWLNIVNKTSFYFSDEMDLVKVNLAKSYEALKENFKDEGEMTLLNYMRIFTKQTKQSLISYLISHIVEAIISEYEEDKISKNKGIFLITLLDKSNKLVDIYNLDIDELIIPLCDIPLYQPYIDYYYAFKMYMSISSYYVNYTENKIFEKDKLIEFLPLTIVLLNEYLIKEGEFINREISFMHTELCKLNLAIKNDARYTKISDFLSLIDEHVFLLAPIRIDNAGNATFISTKHHKEFNYDLTKLSEYF